MMAKPFEYRDMFGDAVDLRADWEQRPLLLCLLRDFASKSSLAIGASLVRPNDEINANAFAVRVLSLEAGADAMSFMADSGCNSPVGSVALEAIPRDVYPVVDAEGRAREGVFVIDGGELVFAKAPATLDDFAEGLRIVRARVASPESAAPNTILDDLRAALRTFDEKTGLPSDPMIFGPLVYRAMQAMASPRPEDQALVAELAPLLEELSVKAERVVGPSEEGDEDP
jgi:hypothetical protein